MLTDVQIYEKRPDLKALNDEYAEIGRQLPALANQISEAANAALAAQQSARDHVNAAIEAVQAAQKRHQLVVAQEKARLQQAQAALENLQSQQRQLTERRAEVQRLHNAGLDAAQAEYAAAQDLPEIDGTVEIDESLDTPPTESKSSRRKKSAE